MTYRITLLALLPSRWPAAARIHSTAQRCAAGRRARSRTTCCLRAREVRGTLCGQTVDVRDEHVLRILSDTCAHPTLWTVGWLFSYAERGQVAVDRCAHYDPDAGCMCRDAIELQVEYDPNLGYPRDLYAPGLGRRLARHWLLELLSAPRHAGRLHNAIQC
jgi:hypothetical protein